MYQQENPNAKPLDRQTAREMSPATQLNPQNTI